MKQSCCSLEGVKKLQSNELSHIIEAVLFVAGEPVALEDLTRALEVSELEMTTALDALASEYDYHRRGIRLNRFGHHVQLATRADYAPYVEKLLQPVQKQSLSQKAMETLAVVAYRQPVTKGEVEAVRGMKCDYSIQSLVNKGLIEEVGRKEALGRPILYGTTDKFLDHFGISSLAELPQLPEMETETADSELPLIP
ncbi:MAG: SMC-Scp complex subunit ScpB [Clostridia bacterium]|nr:SMC-Scp complex subunit ScpB [Clostridia bacterium]